MRTYRVHFAAWAAAGFTLADPATQTFESAEDARAHMARRIASWRRRGNGVVVLESGREYELLEPEDCFMVPDDCGLLWMDSHPVYGSCGECGTDLEMDGRCSIYCPDCQEE